MRDFGETFSPTFSQTGPVSGPEMAAWFVSRIDGEPANEAIDTGAPGPTPCDLERLWIATARGSRRLP